MNPWETWRADGSGLERGEGWESPDAWGGCRAWCILRQLARGGEVGWQSEVGEGERK